jgi:VIT1/CCC1 family predicted Fe2+/Mn2+ transporter
MSLLGVILYLLHDQSLIFPAALSGAISSAMSMAGGEYMSDSDNGLVPSLIMGLATGLGGILPALPFAFARGAGALVLMGAICVLIGLVVGLMRARTCVKHTFRQEVFGTFALLGGIFAVVLACALIFPSPG